MKYFVFFPNEDCSTTNVFFYWISISNFTGYGECEKIIDYVSLGQRTIHGLYAEGRWEVWLRKVRRDNFFIEGSKSAAQYYTVFQCFYGSQTSNLIALFQIALIFDKQCAFLIVSYHTKSSLQPGRTPRANILL